MRPPPERVEETSRGRPHIQACLLRDVRKVVRPLRARLLDHAAMNTANRARIARARAKRLGLRLSQCGTVFTVTDTKDVTLAVGPLGVVDRYLIDRIRPKPPGPPPSTTAPEAWQRYVDNYLLTLSAAGQRPATIRPPKAVLYRTARGLACPPADVSAENLVNWFARQQHWSPEARHSYRCTLCGFFVWMYETGRTQVCIAEALPAVRVPKAPPRPTTDRAWERALAGADQRVELMLRLAAEAGLRRAEVAGVHARDLIDVDSSHRLLVRGKGGHERMVPISDYLAALIREEARDSWAFPNGSVAT